MACGLPGADESPLAGQVISKCNNDDDTCDFDWDYSVYNSWAPAEPNNAGNEWAAVTNWGGAGLWNDLQPNSGGISGYVVEFGGKLTTTRSSAPASTASSRPPATSPSPTRTPSPQPPS